MLSGPFAAPISIMTRVYSSRKSLPSLLPSCGGEHLTAILQSMEIAQLKAPLVPASGLMLAADLYLSRQCRAVAWMPISCYPLISLAQLLLNYFLLWWPTMEKRCRRSSAGYAWCCLLMSHRYFDFNWESHGTPPVRRVRCVVNSNRDR